MWFSYVFSGLRRGESEYIFKRNNTSISILFCCVFRLLLLTNSNSCLLKYVYPNDKLHLPCFLFFFLNLSQLAFPTDFYECNRKEYGKIGLKESGNCYRSRIECISWKVVQTSWTEFGILTSFSFTLPLSMERPMEWNTYRKEKFWSFGILNTTLTNDTFVWVIVINISIYP